MHLIPHPKTKKKIPAFDHQNIEIAHMIPYLEIYLMIERESSYLIPLIIIINRPGADPCILTGYREVQLADEGCDGEKVESLKEGCGEEERIPITKNHELSFMYPAVRRFSVNLLAIFER